jgi:hypothetical protein
MKKKLFVLTTAFLLTFSITFAQNNKPVPDAVVTALHQDFSEADNVEWTTTDQFYKANFTMEGNPLEVFYSFDGEHIAISRKISLEQLPLSLIKEVKKKEKTGTITDLFELLTNRGTEYFISFRNNKEVTTYKSSGEYWSRY